MSIVLNDNIKINAGKPSESKYLTPTVLSYTGTSQVITNVPISERHIGLTVNINNEEYWFKDGLTDVDLVVKGSGGSTVNADNGLTKVGDTIILGGALTGDTVIDLPEANSFFVRKQISSSMPSSYNEYGMFNGANLIASYLVGDGVGGYDVAYDGTDTLQTYYGVGFGSFHVNAHKNNNLDSEYAQLTVSLNAGVEQAYRNPVDNVQYNQRLYFGGFEVNEYVSNQVFRIDPLGLSVERGGLMFPSYHTGDFPDPTPLTFRFAYNLDTSTLYYSDGVDWLPYASGGGTIDAANGLTKLSGTIVLGGSLTGNTTISGNSKNITINGLSSFNLSAVQVAPTASLIANSSIDLGTFVYGGASDITFTIANNLVGGVTFHMFSVSSTDGSSVSHYGEIDRDDNGAVDYNAGFWFTNTYEILVAVPNDLATYPYISYFYNAGHGYPGTTGWYANPVSGYEVDSSDRPLNIAAINEYLALEKLTSVVATVDDLNITTDKVHIVGNTNITGNTRVVGRVDVQGAITGSTIETFIDDGSYSYTHFKAADGIIEGDSGLAGGGTYSFQFNPFYDYGVSIGKLYFGHDGSSPVGGGILDLRNDSNQILFNNGGNLDLTSDYGVNLNSNSGSINLNAYSADVNINTPYLYANVDNDINITSYYGSIYLSAPYGGQVNLYGDLINIQSDSNDVFVQSMDNTLHLNGNSIVVSADTNINVTTGNLNVVITGDSLTMNHTAQFPNIAIQTESTYFNMHSSIFLTAVNASMYSQGIEADPANSTTGIGWIRATEGYIGLTHTGVKTGGVGNEVELLFSSDDGIVLLDSRTVKRGIEYSPTTDIIADYQKHTLVSKHYSTGVTSTLLTKTSFNSFTASTLNSANNGLTKVGTNVRLGGTLTGNTSINNSTGGTLLYFDNTNRRIGVGTSSPAAKLDVRAAAGSTSIFRLATAANVQKLAVNDNGEMAITIPFSSGGYTALRVLLHSGADIFNVSDLGAITFAGGVGLLNVNTLALRSNSGEVTIKQSGDNAGSNMVLLTGGVQSVQYSDIIFRSASTGVPRNLARFFGSGNVTISESSTDPSTTKLEVRGIGTTTNNILRLADSANTQRFSVSDNGSINIPKTMTATGTTGAVTINLPMGQVNFAPGASTLVVTNGLAGLASNILVQLYSNDTTAKSAIVTRAAGSFTITLNASATALTTVGFFVFN